MAHRFFVNPEQVKGDKIKITGDDIQHIVKVLRLKNGAEVVIADGTGQEYYGKIVDIAKEQVLVAVSGRQLAKEEPPVEVTLVQGIPKGDKMELIIQKCTELGIAKIIPVDTARTIVQLSPEKAKARRVRWQKIAEEAAKQSQRSKIPLVEEVQPLKTVLEKMADKLLIVPWEEEKTCALKVILKQSRHKKEAALLIGPEGGLEESEIEFAKAKGAVPVTLGPRILRTETAGWAALTMILYELGDLGGTTSGG